MSKRKHTLFDFGYVKARKQDSSADEAPSGSDKVGRSDDSENSAKSDQVVTSDNSVISDKIPDLEPFAGSSRQNDDSNRSEKNVDSGEKSTESHQNFQASWLKDYEWLTYDKEKDLMFCRLCKSHRKNNKMVKGCSNYRTSTLTRHVKTADHQACLESIPLREAIQEQSKRVLDGKEKGIIKCLKSVYYLVKEDLPLSKYGSLVTLLKELHTPDMANVNIDEHTTYESSTTANTMLTSLASVINGDIKTKLKASPVVSVLADESCDIANQKKLVVYARIIDPNTFIPSTLFLKNIKVADGTGATVASAILECLEEYEVPMPKVYGFGSDGAKVMTGVKEGVTGHLLRQQPMLINFHCIAHRLALVSSQAAAEIPYLKEYQETLTSLFYFFKCSANRCEKLKNIQQLLEEDEIKIKEVHDVRWMSIYKAVEAVYRSIDSLITLFSSEKEPKAKGFAKKMATQDFIATTYMLMDILPIITELCLVFQKKELDVSVVETNIDHCKRKLEKLKERPEEDSVQPQCFYDTMEQDLKVEKGKLIFKENHIIAKGSRNIQSLRNQFVDKLIEKLNDRFPPHDSEILFAMGALGMRPVTFLSKKDLAEWGNQKMETLIEHFGKEKEHTYQGTVSKSGVLIDAVGAREEWSKLKHQVVNSGYPRDKLSVLWGMINSNHKEEYPNMLKLGAVAITAPIHTCDCERGFSVQNIIKTSKRNRLAPEKMNELMLVSAQGPPRKEFDFEAALQHWRTAEERRIFKKK